MSRTWICEICGWNGNGTARSIHCDSHRKKALEILKTKNTSFPVQMYVNWKIVVNILTLKKVDCVDAEYK